MLRRFLTLGALASLATAACQSGTAEPTAGPQPTPAASAEPAAAAAAPGIRSTREGIYTVAQAARGEEVFQAVCSECHEPADYTQTAFLNRWAGEPVYQLFYQIHNTMPYGAPSSLTRQQYTDLLAYIFQLNNLPAGAEELGSDDDSLDSFDIEWGEGR
jgi:mono/diheme cytochrome c family protein